MKTRNREHRTKKPVSIPVGTPLGIHDCNGTELCMGDFVVLLGTPYCGKREGRIFELERHSVIVALPRYESHNLPLDDGARMRVQKMTDEEAEPWREWYTRTWEADMATQKPHHIWKKRFRC